MESDRYEKHIRAEFKFFAFWYGLFDLVFLIDPRRNPLRALAEMIPNDELEILDVCVGTANSSIAVARQNEKNHITGIDLSPDMIAVAQRKIGRPWRDKGQA